jgi:hypothetical protein
MTKSAVTLALGFCDQNQLPCCGKDVVDQVACGPDVTEGNCCYVVVSAIFECGDGG